MYRDASRLTRRDDTSHDNDNDRKGYKEKDHMNEGVLADLRRGLTL